ncbi:2-acylglycerol O-acyltransferase 3b isoform X2 [Syngnathoides biaculeatus]|uniref:2-acylglycerol O-acyltransferase 3b isoform X2 n=1 Tax=Syngnathoides biaculeatus TaxID=300417 RepID=UPI002ADD408E|nr:2-acylglycerol O-acyltransferase 3b isoform X2 [Syngnathoides biaculeatus]XP_061659004.1 2-acylglycerol O-acyltransferase 3b isoform X2 [Syngnathoides biaculeatus]
MLSMRKSQRKDFLEAFSVLQWILTFLFLGLTCIILTVALMFTSLWLLPTLYFIWLLIDWQTPEKGGRRKASVRRWKIWEHYRDYFPLKLVKTAELNPNKNYILGCHPHGIMSIGAFGCFNIECCGFSEAFPGMRVTLAILAGLFRIPIFRDYLMAAGLCPVSKASLGHLLSRRGPGNAVVIVIGGAAESLASRPGVQTVVVKQRKGFVRLALEFGADLVPVYSFGETELFRQVAFSEGSLARRLQDLFRKVSGFAPCLFIGHRWALLPSRTPVTTVVGRPIPVPQRVAPTDEEVERYHQLYVDGLSNLFHEHKVSCGLPESHELCFM